MSDTKNWHVEVICKDCGTRYRVDEPNYSREVFDGRKRAIVLTIANECPECRNLKVVMG